MFCMAIRIVPMLSKMGAAYIVIGIGVKVNM